MLSFPFPSVLSRPAAQQASRWATVALVPLLGMVVAAQTTRARAPISSAVADAHCVVADGERCIAEGAAYRAVFTGDGIAFTPALGTRVPHAQHLRLQLRAIARGRTPLPAPTLHVAPALDAGAVVFARGAVQERFDVRADGLALSLHFAAMPPGDGDLVVRYALDTELPLAAADARGLFFALPRVGGVRISQVFGIDADGRVVAGSLQHGDGCLELVLPHAFVAHARYPIVLDPLIGTEFHTGVASDVNGEPDAAFDATTGRHLVVWRRAFSADHRSIRAQLVSAAGNLVGSLLLVRDLTPLHCQHPSVANDLPARRFVVVWEEANSVFAPGTIRGRSVAASDGTMAAVADISPLGVTCASPFLSGCTRFNTLLVAWVEPGVVRLAQLSEDLAGNVIVGATTRVNPGGLPARVAISRSHDSGARYVVAWLDDRLQELWVRSYDRRLIVPGSPVRAQFLLGEEFRGFAVDGDGADFVLAFGQTRAPSAQSDVRCVPLRVDSETGAVQLGAFRDLEGSATVEAFDPAIAFLGPKFSVAWTRVNEADTNVEGIDLAPDCSACGTPWAITGVNTLQGHAAFSTERAGGTLTDAALLVCTDTLATLPFQGQIRARRLAAFGPGTTPNIAGPGCGNAGLIGTTGGPFVLGNRDFQVVLAGAPSGAAVFVSIGVPGNELPCGTCTFVNGFLVQSVPLVGTGASFPFPVPCVPGYLGLTLSTQWLVLGAAGASCPLVPSLAATARMHLRVGE